MRYPELNGHPLIIIMRFKSVTDRFNQAKLSIKVMWVICVLLIIFSAIQISAVPISPNDKRVIKFEGEVDAVSCREGRSKRGNKLVNIVSIRSNDFPEFNFYTSENCDTIVGLVSNKHIVAKGYNSSPNDEYFIALDVQIDNREIAGFYSEKYTGILNWILLMSVAIYLLVFTGHRQVD